MQDIIDKAELALTNADHDECSKQLIEAIKLLSRAQAQTMRDLKEPRFSTTDTLIGGQP